MLVTCDLQQEIFWYINKYKNWLLNRNHLTLNKSFNILRFSMNSGEIISKYSESYIRNFFDLLKLDKVQS